MIVQQERVVPFPIHPVWNRWRNHSDGCCCSFVSIGIGVLFFGVTFSLFLDWRFLFPFIQNGSHHLFLFHHRWNWIGWNRISFRFGFVLFSTSWLHYHVCFIHVVMCSSTMTTTTTMSHYFFRWFSFPFGLEFFLDNIQSRFHLEIPFLFQFLFGYHHCILIILLLLVNIMIVRKCFQSWIRFNKIISVFWNCFPRKFLYLSFII